MAPEPEPIVAPSSARPRIGVLVLVLGLAVGILLLDQLAKWLVVSNLPEGVAVPVIGELVQFEFVRNPGAAFSLGIGATWIFAIIACAVAVFIVVFARRIRSLAWATVFGMLLGGTIGNLVDRLFREPGFGQGHVIDFIRIWGFPAIFNVADMAITFSVVILVILTIAGHGLDGRRSRGSAAEPVAPAAGATDGDA
ncbi:MAG: signal peptidase II [Micrococcales bacterium 73-13]|nr:MAG: signal peptidase II [Micrococcales bacterium 73-13]